MNAVVINKRTYLLQHVRTVLCIPAAAAGQPDVWYVITDKQRNYGAWRWPGGRRNEWFYARLTARKSTPCSSLLAAVKAIEQECMRL